MRRIVFFVLLCVFIAGPVRGQIGIGASGGFQYPGLVESDKYKTRFAAGPGYGFFIRHDLYTLAEKYHFHARYQVKFYFNDINLPNAGATRYKFNEFSVDVWMNLWNIQRYTLYSGVSLNLLNVVGASKFRSDYTGTLIFPLLITGVEYKLSDFYNVYSEIFLQFAEIDAGPEPLPISGFGLLIGVTMYISE